MKWNSQVTAIDIATGEEVPKEKIKNGEYLVIKKTVNTIIEKHYGTRSIKWHCKRNNQIRIEW